MSFGLRVYELQVAGFLDVLFAIILRSKITYRLIFSQNVFPPFRQKNAKQQKRSFFLCVLATLWLVNILRSKKAYLLYLKKTPYSLLGKICEATKAKLFSLCLSDFVASQYFAKQNNLPSYFFTKRLLAFSAKNANQ